MGRITVSPHVNGSRVSWRVRTNKPDDEAADEAASWTSGQSLMGISKSVRTGETRQDRRAFTITVGDWIEAHYHSLGHTEHEFAKVCGIRGYTDEDGGRIYKLCVSWGVEVGVFNRNAYSAGVKAFVDDNSLDGLTVCPSDQFDIIDLHQVNDCIKNTDSDVIIVEDCVRENLGSDVKLCGRLYGSVWRRTEATKTLDLGEIVTELPGSEDEEEEVEPRRERQSTQEAIDAGNEEEEEEEDDSGADNTQPEGRGAIEALGSEDSILPERSDAGSERDYSGPLQRRRIASLTHPFPHNRRPWAPMPASEVEEEEDSYEVVRR
ncbi:hypothetical protein BDZ85DRAFT_281035 [Elsinoe ampelina]|uniref:Uncharacterized protein n=1 Tax=Elsinoe ampelina TaxID=302913 RepID=A0A6A6GFQ5_9PEZI|nr:hypothetical protein BDZ85DRAFT_281035 [Elsinoe ampelina]